MSKMYCEGPKRPSGTLQGAGGIGGLLSVTEITGSETNTYYPFYDANGNITDYVDTNGVVVAHREFDPFGNTIVATGDKANDFRFWFSSKCLDAETGLYYYGYRYFDPSTGRFLSRDPIGERGGRNLYCFVKNNPVTRSDFLGLMGNAPPSSITKGCCGSQIYDLSTQCCCDGKTVENRAETDTGVAVCEGYIKGDWLWGWVSSHTFLRCGGKGFGLYAKSHLEDGCGCEAVYDDGVIKDDDLDVYPELPNPGSGQSYSKCTPVKLSSCKYDIKQFEKCVCAFNQPGYNPDYMILGWNCSSFADNAISHCKDQAKKTTCK